MGLRPYGAWPGIRSYLITVPDNLYYRNGIL
jgi:hypothetical protein